MTVNFSINVLLALLLTSAASSDVRVRRHRLEDHEKHFENPNFALRKCIKCNSFKNCVDDNWTIMPCAKEAIANLPFGEIERKVFEKLNHTDLNNTDKATHCAIVQWKQSEIRACVPETLNEKAFCTYFKEKTEVKLTMCEMCPADVKPCNDAEPPREDGAELTATHNLAFSCLCMALIAILIR
ncbi:uncharacterized protein LOC123012624 [Tribolium madens]|uniref:uncharacterized protein LOC123012624 n=1 Tax=Tribolium madens TaxID=41895 RepID=UPI001CF7294B|nr:uncharacterized protein LOC123012624 [Tribolium madens]